MVCPKACRRVIGERGFSASIGRTGFSTSTGQFYRNFLLEQHIAGFEHRVYVVDGVAVSAYQSVPNHVVGNGFDTLRALFAARQDQRKHNPFQVDKPADMAEVEMALLARGGAWTDVPAQGQIVWLAAKSIPDSQTDFIPSLETLPSAARALAVAATQAVAAYNAAVDMIVTPSGTAFVLEINIRAYIGAHSFPNTNSSYNLTLPNAIVQSLFGKQRLQHRDLVAFDFQALEKELFREGRRAKGLDAADFVQFG